MILLERIRKIFKIQQILQELKENRKLLNEIRWANVFNNTIDGSEWLQDKSFSPGTSAIGYPMFYVLYRILDDIKPRNILEFGLGESSSLLFRYASHYNEINVTTLEHDLEWVEFYKINKNLPHNAKILIVENIKIKYKGFETLSIKDLGGLLYSNKFDLILVDAPFGSPRYSRSQMLSLVPNNINENHFCILIDDFDRVGEKDTCAELEGLFKQNGIFFYKGVYYGLKEFVIYCSKDLKFLITL